MDFVAKAAGSLNCWAGLERLIAGFAVVGVSGLAR